MNPSERFYKDQISEKSSINDKLVNKIRIIGILRLLVVLSAVISGYISYKNNSNILFFISCKEKRYVIHIFIS